MYQTNKNYGEELLIPDAVTFDAGLFVMADFYYSKKSYWQTGLRIDGRRIGSKEHGEDGEEGYFPEFSKSYTANNFSLYPVRKRNCTSLPNAASPTDADENEIQLRRRTYRHYSEHNGKQANHPLFRLSVADKYNGVYS